MTGTAIVLEPDGLLFHTDMLRSQALHAALADEGVGIAEGVVAVAHLGVTASMALDALGAALSLDDTGRDLVLRRTADRVRAALDGAMPNFDPIIAGNLQTLAAVYPLAVVSRATRADAERMLEQANLSMLVRTVRSLDGLAEADQQPVWTAAVAHCLASRGIAIAPAPLRSSARRAGLATIDAPGGATLQQLAAADAAFIDTLF